MPVTGAVIREALAAVGAVGKQMRSFDELAAGANTALAAAPAGLTGLGCASWLADKAQESDFFRVTEEYAKNGRYAPFFGRTFQMITWERNYLGFGVWCKDRGHIQNSERQFVDDPPWLADYRWAWLGGVWYFEVNGLWRYANAGDHYTVSVAVNRGVGAIGKGKDPLHWDVRKRMFEVFARFGDQLLPADRAPAAPAPAPVGGPDTIPRLNEGDVNAAVHKLATWLNRMYPAYSNIDIDPNPSRQRYGPQTSAALKEFQRRTGVRNGDGRNIGPQTQQALWREGYRP